MNSNKFPIEKHQSKLILDAIDNPKIQPLREIIAAEGDFRDAIGRRYYSQYDIWALGAKNILDKERFDKLYLGWCLDDEISEEERASRLNGMDRLVKVQIETPLFNMSKKDYDIPKHVAEHIWSCEGPIYEPHELYEGVFKITNCGCCNPCGLERDLDIFHKRTIFVDKSEFHDHILDLQGLSKQARGMAFTKYKLAYGNTLEEKSI